MSKAKARVVEPADDLQRPVSWRRRPWVPVAIAAVMLAVVLGAGAAASQALKPIVPAALAKCTTTSAQLGPRLYAGPQPMCIDPSRTYEATIVTTAGDVVADLTPQSAPVTVNNFVVLSINGFYNGLAFWKVESWVVQTGDPNGNGTGGPGYTLPEEPSQSAWPVGSLGMARPPGGPINGSQFFITTQAWPGSGPEANFNPFGTVVTGLDKVQAMTTSDRVISISIKVVSSVPPSPSPS